MLIADDHEVVRQGLQALLDLEPDLEFIGDARDGHEAVEMARSLAPDAMVVDVAMPRLDGFEATRRILVSRPATRVLLLSAHSGSEYVRRAAECGAVAFVPKCTPFTVLAHAIRTSRARHALLPPHDTNSGFSHTPSTTPRVDFLERGPQLTPREAEVLQAIVRSKSNKQTAHELGISVKTVEKHRQAVMDKLDIHDVAGLTRYAVGTGIVDCWRSDLG